ncbi:LysR substrate-binding domain-containing protein [Prosthecomicrobium hirschii]|uniref:LysR substrate-binding domain-containing protein n=1 Tax=Prosthecodimorpha hirschii TaxID=665126 RepID=UPI00221E8498|nr:LysR substrate-binding domain-containing protein [Prosthecomicrobium hirschii]MCW1840517.1 LysR substrate-binding domain-containing protein [Prosthecomicrobium hirschii]
MSDATTWRLLPAMAVFEAAGRLSSFTRAGRELGISQESVSYAIRKLEQEIGRPLFERGHRQVALTPTGRELHDHVGMGLGHVRRAFEALQPARERDGLVTLSCSTAFVRYWLLPRLAEFQADLPAIDLRLQTTDRDLDIAAEGVDLGIRYGSGIFGHYESAVFAPEVIYPVASPRLTEKSGEPMPWSLATLATAPLIHLEEPVRPCSDWFDFARDTGMPPIPRSGLKLNDYSLVLQAALEGQGVALGWHHLVDSLIASGFLVRPVAEDWRTVVDYCVVWSGPLGPAARSVRDWLVARGYARAEAEAG